MANISNDFIQNVALSVKTTAITSIDILLDKVFFAFPGEVKPFMKWIVSFFNFDEHV